LLEPRIAAHTFGVANFAQAEQFTTELPAAAVRDQEPLFGSVASDSTAFRLLDRTLNRE
jgi:hypothetical protein